VSEDTEAMYKGPKGDKGDRGMPAGQRRAIIYLFAVAFFIGGANLLFTSHEIGQNNAKWCATIITLDNADQAAEHAPPSQKPHGAYSDALIRDFHVLRGQLGCG
jgi:hypothetical protein